MTTGATPAQIERALPDVLRIIWGVEDGGERGSIMPYLARGAISVVVPATAIIVDRTDLAQAIRKAQESPNPTRESEAAIDRLTAALKEPTA